MFSILLAAYWTVLVAELIGDKSVYTVTSLAMRYSAASVYSAISAAFMGKMLVAVLFGSVVMRLPGTLVAVISSATFFATAVVLWRKEPRPALAESGTSRSNGWMVCFATIFFSEWADVGQISAAVLVAQYRAPLAIWAGATFALMTKGLLALTFGMQLRRRVPARVLKFAAVCSCVTLGVLALIGLR